MFPVEYVDIIRRAFIGLFLITARSSSDAQERPTDPLLVASVVAGDFPEESFILVFTRYHVVVSPPSSSPVEELIVLTSILIAPVTDAILIVIDVSVTDASGEFILTEIVGIQTLEFISPN